MKWKKKTGIVLGVLLFLVFICIDKIDTTPVFFTQAYQHTLQSIENTSLTSLEANTLQAGWAKVNITPNHSTRMAGFRMKSFNDVHDSVYVRCMLFDVGGKKIAWLSFDLIFVHPYLKNAIEQKVNENNLADFVYYTATHTPQHWRMGFRPFGSNTLWLRQRSFRQPHTASYKCHSPSQ